MNINFEKLPTIVFDWMETFSFEQLNHSQQKEILNYFSVEEYNEMHQTFLDLKSVSVINNSEDSQERKSLLLDHFDKHHPVKQTISSQGKLFIWQAAALLLLMLSGWLFYRIFDLKKDPTIEQVAAIDTVYVTREVTQEPEIIHDTVYRYKEMKNSSQKNNSSPAGVIEKEDIESIGEMEVQPLLELENLTNTPKGNSMKDDSLLRKFGFVSM